MKIAKVINCLTLVLSLILLAVIECGVVMYLKGYRFNYTQSYPTGIWAFEDSPPALMDLALVCPPDNHSTQEAKKRNYIIGGKCPGDFREMIKRIYAGPGSVVVVTESEVLINGAKTADIQKEDSRGRPMRPFIGIHVLGHDEFWVMSEEPQSFDSRYFGPIKPANIAGKIKKL